MDEPHQKLVKIDVIESGGMPKAGYAACEIWRHINFSTKGLQTYGLARWAAVHFDLLVLAAAVEFCDRIEARSVRNWGRKIEVRIPVHDVSHWENPSVSESLRNALNFLTGDIWLVTFVSRSRNEPAPIESAFDLPDEDVVIMPYSDGMDSRAVAEIIEEELHERLIRVRLGPKQKDHRLLNKGRRRRRPFTAIPYRVKAHEYNFPESSGRSRGFKFSVIAGIAAHLVGASRVVNPESGQGALGPWLVAVGQAPEDCRNHPMFTQLMEVFFKAVLGHQLRFEFPRLWSTKGQTLARLAGFPDSADWAETVSCWQQNRHSSVGISKRQCGICAACMLRRMSVHAAGLSEPSNKYVWERLDAPTWAAGAAPGFDKLTQAMKHYAIAGTLHLDHLAKFQHSRAGRHAMALRVAQLSQAMGRPEAEIEIDLRNLLSQHQREWEAFVESLGKDSFVANWIN